MTTTSDWTCPCRAVNSSAAVWCEACGAERPDRPARPGLGQHKVPETQQLWTPPTYPAPTPEDDALIRAERAKLHAAAWWRDTPGPARLPPVDPAIRAEVARRDAQAPEPVGAVVPRVLTPR